MITFPYDQAYDPAAPACQITLHVPATGRRMNSDATIVPVRVLRQVAARRSFEATMRSQWGERRRVYLYLVDLQLETLTLPGIYVVGDDQGDEVVLGRDVLNRLRVLLDGPGSVSQVLE